MSAFLVWVVPHIAEELVTTVPVPRIAWLRFNNRRALFRCVLSVIQPRKYNGQDAQYDRLLEDLASDLWYTGESYRINDALIYGYRPLLNIAMSLPIGEILGALTRCSGNMCETYWSFYDEVIAKWSSIQHLVVENMFVSLVYKIYCKAISSKFENIFTTITCPLIDILTMTIGVYEHGNDEALVYIKAEMPERPIWAISDIMRLARFPEFNDLLMSNAWWQNASQLIDVYGEAYVARNFDLCMILKTVM